MASLGRAYDGIDHQVARTRSRRQPARVAPASRSKRAPASGAAPKALTAARFAALNAVVDAEIASGWSKLPAPPRSPEIDVTECEHVPPTTRVRAARPSTYEPARGDEDLARRASIAAAHATTDGSLRARVFVLAGKRGDSFAIRRLARTAVALLGVLGVVRSVLEAPGVVDPERVLLTDRAVSEIHRWVALVVSELEAFVELDERGEDTFGVLGRAFTEESALHALSSVVPCLRGLSGEPAAIAARASIAGDVRRLIDDVHDELRARPA